MTATSSSVAALPADHSRLRWADAVAAADFSFYELGDPSSDHRWAGGYGTGGPDRRTSTIEVLHLINGVEVSVTTRRDGRTEGHRHSTALLSDLALHMVFDDPELTLPLTWTFSESDRSIAIDGVMTEFMGVQFEVAGRPFGGWAGTAQDMHDNIVDIKVRGVGPVPAAITTCTDLSMSDRPPNAG